MSGAEHTGEARAAAAPGPARRFFCAQLATALGLAAAVWTGGDAKAATAVGSFNVTITITAQCAVTNPTSMAFPSTGLLSSPVNQTSTFTVACTNATPFTIGLDAGLYASGAQRRMRGGATNSEFVSYNLYSDAARTVAWTGSGGGLVNGTGTGANVSYTVYGQAPAQTTPSPGSNYADTVTITVTY